MIKIAIAIVLVLSVFGGIIIYNERDNKENFDLESTGANVQPTITPTNMKLPKNIIDSKETYSAKVTTSKGTFTIELKKGETPKTVNICNIISKGFANNTIFQSSYKRIYDSGETQRDRNRGPGYKFEDEK